MKHSPEPHDIPLAQASVRKYPLRLRDNPPATAPSSDAWSEADTLSRSPVIAAATQTVAEARAFFARRQR